MTTFLGIQNEVIQTLHGYGLDQPRAAFLSGSITSSATSFTVTDASSVEQGLAEIEGELVYIESVDRTTDTVTLSPDGRGYYGTTAATHAANTRMTIAPTWPRNRVKQAINDVIASVYPSVFGVAQTQFDFSPAVSTYSLPAEAEAVLSVTADLNGPSQEQQQIRHYAFSAKAPTDDFATGRSISLHESVTPGRTVTVTYKKQPSALSADSDLLTASGLRTTARLMIVYGACSQLLAFMDASRLPVSTAEASGYAENNQVGQASRISGQLYLRFQAELEAERARLRETTPPIVRMRKR